MNLTNALTAIAKLARPAAVTPVASAIGIGPASDREVIAIIRLSNSRRSWFVTGVQRVEHELTVVGYTPGCPYSAGRWFSLRPDFFAVAAESVGDELEIKLLDTPTPLALLEDEAL